MSELVTEKSERGMALLNSLLGKAEERFLAVCDMETFKREASFATQVFQRDPKLLDDLITVEGKQSFLSSIMNIANMGITLNPARKLAYLITRADRYGQPKKFCLDISYKGLITLATKEGIINASFEGVVREGDEFVMNGLDKLPEHRFNPFETGRNKKKIIGAYCAVKLPDGTWKTETMDIDEIEKIRQSSKSKDNDYSPWNKWYDQMCIKTVIKRAYKFWNYGKNDTILDKAIDYLNVESGEGVEVVQHKTALKAQRLTKIVDAPPVVDEFYKEYDNAEPIKVSNEEVV